MKKLMTNKNISKRPLLVDLDGSLIATDTLYETVILLIKTKLWMIFLFPIWLLQGKQVLKQRITEQVDLDAAILPFNQEVITYLEQQHKRGRKIILCTGSWHSIAEQVAELFDWIDEVVATDEKQNLTGCVKAAWAVDRFGEKGFDYLGNEEKDLKVWQYAGSALVVGNQTLSSRVGRVTEIEQLFQTSSQSLKVWLKAIRIHQWAKNTLVFVPLITAHLFNDASAVFSSIVAFISLGLCASATYVLNDLLDLESDRQHSIKCNRPLAAGLIGIPQSIVVALVMLGLSFYLAFSLGQYFLWALTSYLVITVSYSFKLKRLQTVDVICLACLFTVRVIAGAAAIGVEPSFWLLCFSMFMFLSLALVKRVAELIRVDKEAAERNSLVADDEKIKGRGYFTADIVILQSLGGASGFLAVFVFALYINSEEVVNLYHHPEILWFLCPVLGYWIMRIWMLTARNQMQEDPISFAIIDKNSWLSFVFMLLVMTAAVIF